MSLKDKLEVGLKPNAPYRPDNLPRFQREDPACQDGSEPGKSARLRRARADCDTTPVATRRRRSSAGPKTKGKAR